MHQLSEGAKRLLWTLQHGGNIAEPNVYPGSLSFNDHAIAYLSNAVAICQTNAMDDFRVFNGLYNIRHGLELWLKCMLQNRIIDATLGEISNPQASFEDVVKTAGPLSRDAKTQLSKALCILRNVCEDGLQFPACREQKIGPEFANRAMTYIRENGQLPRERLAVVWSVPILTHDLIELWNDAESFVREMHAHAVSHSEVVGLGPPMGLQDIESACKLLGALDRSGDAFRYPSSIHNLWFLEIPHVSLDRLAELADGLEATVRSYDALLGDAYGQATLRSPGPNCTAW